MLTFPGCHFPVCTNNPFQFWRLIQVSVYKHQHLLALIPLNPFSLQIASRTAGQSRYTQVTRSITTCGACGLLRENGELHVLHYLMYFITSCTTLSSPLNAVHSTVHVHYDLNWTRHRIPHKSQALILLNFLQIQIKTCTSINTSRIIIKGKLPRWSITLPYMQVSKHFLLKLSIEVVTYFSNTQDIYNFQVKLNTTDVQEVNLLMKSKKCLRYFSRTILLKFC